MGERGPSLEADSTPKQVLNLRAEIAQQIHQREKHARGREVIAFDARSTIHLAQPHGPVWDLLCQDSGRSSKIEWARSRTIGAGVTLGLSHCQTSQLSVRRRDIPQAVEDLAQRSFEFVLPAGVQAGKRQKGVERRDAVGVACVILARVLSDASGPTAERVFCRLQ
jgi:hypothetical protein